MVNGARLSPQVADSRAEIARQIERAEAALLTAELDVTKANIQKNIDRLKAELAKLPAH